MDVIADLKSRGYKTKTVKIAGKGRNGLVYKLWTENNEEYALKIVSGKKLKNGKSRAAQEAEFTRYLDCIDEKRHPELKEYSASDNWILTKWITGGKAKRFDNKNIEQVIEFILTINERKHWKERGTLSKAIDSYRSVDDCIEDVERRFSDYKKMMSSKENEWGTCVLKEYIEKNIEDAKKRKLVQVNKSWWKAEEKELIVSPSDIGIHNTLIRNGVLFFYDFEYGGMDDMSKLICDLVMQPECILSKEIEERVLREIKLGIGNDNWIQRYHAIKPLNIAKWTLIILAQGSIEGKSTKKAQEYFEKAIERQDK